MKPIKEEELHFVAKGWGFERWIVNKEYCGKILHFYHGKHLSWHYHNVKDEVFHVLSGKVLVKYSWEDDIEKAEEVVLEKGMTFHIPTGLRHRVVALEESNVLEVSTHHEDSDSIRLIKGD